MAVSPAGVRPAAFAAALLLLAAALSARALALSSRHPVPVFDEVAYLDEARRYAALGGPAAAIACHWRGECREDNRHPLYAMLASSLTVGGPEDFARLKLLTLACSLALLAAAFAFAARRFGAETGLIFAAMLALSPSLAYVSSRVLADTLFTLLWLAALELLLGGRERRRDWLAFGLACGLAYLAKGTGHLLLLSGAALAWRGRGRGPSAAWKLGLAGAGFALAAGFLLKRNLAVWGSPFHNVNQTFLWLDEWTSMWRLAGTPAWRELGPGAYWSSHTLGQIASRFAAGAASAALELVDACGFGPAAGKRAAGLAVLAAAVHRLYAEARAGRPEPALAVGAAVLPVFGALAFGARIGATGTRLFLPLAAPLMLLAAVSAARALELAAERLPRRARAHALPVLAALLGLLALRPAAWALRLNPAGLWALPADWAATSAWVRAAAGARGYLVPYDSVFSTWDAGPDLRRPYPFEAPDAELKAVLASRGLDVIVLDRALPSGSAPAGRFGREDEAGPTSMLGRPRCFASPGRPSRFLVFARRCR